MTYAVDERLAGRVQPFVVLAQPAVVADPGKERSTTQRRGKTSNPCGGSSFCQSTLTPSLAHCSAHAISTSLGATLRGRSTSSTVHPSVFSTQPLPFSSPR